MRLTFYPKLAWTGVRKNGRLYLPYLLTCTLVTAMFYILLFLSHSQELASARGGTTVCTVLMLGSFVIAAFSLIFLFYTSSFLMRRRNREFGLYNILGMDKRNLSRLLLWETFICAASSILGGLVLGVLLSKLAELGLMNIIRGEVDYELRISPDALLKTLLLYALIHLLICISSLFRLRRLSAVELLGSEKAGEKPPKANWFMGIAGVVILAAAYAIAVSIQDPVSAMMLFFVAVLLVIAATYIIFISGSVVLCRILQKRTTYYYKANHFVSVSSMLYRMKRNGAGLASICILATMVLVMVSSTTSLYFGTENALHSRWPRQINCTLRFPGTEGISDSGLAALKDRIDRMTGDEAGVDSIINYRCAVSYGSITDGTVIPGTDNSPLWELRILPLEDYNALCGASESLEENEVLVCAIRGDFPWDSLRNARGDSFTVKGRFRDFPDTSCAAMNAIPTLLIVTKDMNTALTGLLGLQPDPSGEVTLERPDSGANNVMLYWTYDFDTSLEDEATISLDQHIEEGLSRAISGSSEKDFYYWQVESRELNRADFYGSFGGLFFLGMALSILFILAAVLIIYYKQVSEGYEDAGRFEIMQKVGMTKKDIRRSINSQLLTVFYLPLVFAGLHLAFAFPMISKILTLFNLNNFRLFAATTLLSFAVFSVLYAAIYKVTSNTYYNIVSGRQDE